MLSHNWLAINDLFDAMDQLHLTSVLQSAPEAHQQRCLLAKNAIDTKRWPVAACGLRHAAAMAQNWAIQARQLADWCDAQEKGNAGHSLEAHPLLVGPELGSPCLSLQCR